MTFGQKGLAEKKTFTKSVLGRLESAAIDGVQWVANRTRMKSHHVSIGGLMVLHMVAFSEHDSQADSSGETGVFFHVQDPQQEAKGGVYVFQQGDDTHVIHIKAMSGPNYPTGDYTTNGVYTKITDEAVVASAARAAKAVHQSATKARIHRIGRLDVTGSYYGLRRSYQP